MIFYESTNRTKGFQWVNNLNNKCADTPTENKQRSQLCTWKRYPLQGNTCSWFGNILLNVDTLKKSLSKRKNEETGVRERNEDEMGLQRKSSCLSGSPDNPILQTPPTLLPDSITQAVIKFPSDTQHHPICKKQKQRPDCSVHGATGFLVVNCCKITFELHVETTWKRREASHHVWFLYCCTPEVVFLIYLTRSSAELWCKLKSESWCDLASVWM